MKSILSNDQEEIAAVEYHHAARMSCSCLHCTSGTPPMYYKPQQPRLLGGANANAVEMLYPSCFDDAVLLSSPFPLYRLYAVLLYST